MAARRVRPSVAVDLDDPAGQPLPSVTRARVSAAIVGTLTRAASPTVATSNFFSAMIMPRKYPRWTVHPVPEGPGINQFPLAPRSSDQRGPAPFGNLYRDPLRR